jgi:hypothetical protein
MPALFTKEVWGIYWRWLQEEIGFYMFGIFKQPFWMPLWTRRYLWLFQRELVRQQHIQKAEETHGISPGQLRCRSTVQIWRIWWRSLGSEFRLMQLGGVIWSLENCSRVLLFITIDRW